MSLISFIFNKGNRTHNLLVVGSNPTGPTKIRRDSVTSMNNPENFGPCTQIEVCPQWTNVGRQLSEPFKNVSGSHAWDCAALSVFASDSRGPCAPGPIERYSA